MANASSGPCRAKVGLLVLRECGRAAEGPCASCGLPVCARHLVQGAARTLCPSCAAREEGVPATGAVGRERRRLGYYEHYGYSPLLFGGGGYYTDRDLESVAAPGVDPPAGGPALSKEDLDRYDPFES